MDIPSSQSDPYTPPNDYQFSMHLINPSKKSNHIWSWIYMVYRIFNNYSCLGFPYLHNIGFIAIKTQSILNKTKLLKPFYPTYWLVFIMHALIIATIEFRDKTNIMLIIQNKKSNRWRNLSINTYFFLPDSNT